MHFKNALLSCLVVSVIGLSGCSGTTGASRYDKQSAQDLYTEASKHLKRHDFYLALDTLDALESRYPFGDVADKAQLASIYAYFKNDDYDGAVAAANRFIQLHPRHPDVSYAYYMKGLSNFESSLSGLKRYLPIEHGSQEIETIQEAFFDLSNFVDLFPTNALASDAHLRMIYLKNVLADHQVSAANFYLEKGAPIAAANRATLVLEQFDQSPALPEALSILSRSYDALNLNDLADDTNFILQANYARSPWAQDIGKE